MNIAAIYDKYDLQVWQIVIAGRNFLSPNPSLIESVKRYAECEYCEGTGEVSAPHYTKGGEIPDSDFVKCRHCNGTGEK